MNILFEAVQKFNTGPGSRKIVHVGAPRSVRCAWDLPSDYKEESFSSMSWCGLSLRSSELADFVKWLQWPAGAEEKLDTQT